MERQQHSRRAVASDVAWKSTTRRAIVRVLDNGTRLYVQIEYRCEAYSDNRTTYPMRFGDRILFDLPERVDYNLHTAVRHAFEWMGKQKRYTQ